MKKGWRHKGVRVDEDYWGLMIAVGLVERCGGCGAVWSQAEEDGGFRGTRGCVRALALSRKEAGRDPQADDPPLRGGKEMRHGDHAQ